MMKKIIITTFFLITVIQQANATHWMTSFKDAKKLSVATNKLILIDFWATWCGPCKRMESDTWNKPEVEEILNAYVPLKIDIDVFEKYQINTQRIQFLIF